MNTATSQLYLNMQLITDRFCEYMDHVTLHNSAQSSKLCGVRLYHDQNQLDEKYVYIAKGSALPEFLIHATNSSLITIGQPPVFYLRQNYSILVLPDTCDELKILEFVQSIFDTLLDWSSRLTYALNQDYSLDDICKIGYEQFHNPLFVHDPNFIILACPERPERMTKWDIDPYTGKEVLPDSVINDFKVDPDYLTTLSMHGAQMFPGSQRGYRILYVNIWNEFDQYEGRVCIDEIETSFTASQFLLAEYFAWILKIWFARRNVFGKADDHPFGTFVHHVIEKSITDPNHIAAELARHDWKPNDQYVCIRLGLQSRDKKMNSISSTCHTLQAQLTGSFSMLYNDEILVVVNLSSHENNLSNIIPQLAVIVREGLFVCGVSNQFSVFSDLSCFYEQAGIALNYGTQSGQMFWTYFYDDCALQYLLMESTHHMQAKQLCSYKLLNILDYDKENNTEFYQTLKVYLRNHLNAMQTAKDLFIHRSTLFYRLDRLKTQMHVNLDNPRERLYLEVSYMLLENEAN